MLHFNIPDPFVLRESKTLPEVSGGGLSPICPFRRHAHSACVWGGGQKKQRSVEQTFSELLSEVYGRL